MSIKTKAMFFLAAALALTAPIAHAQESTADPEGFPQVQGTFNNSNIRDCEPNHAVVGVLSGPESFYIMNIESRADGFEYYEILSADDTDPYSGCVRADVLVPYLDSAVSIDAVKAALNERKIPTLNALAQRWQEGKGVSRSRVIPLSTFENDGKVPERLTADRANQLLEQAQAQGIEGAATVMVHNGGTGESLEYAVIVVDSEGNPYYQVNAADNQAAQQQESHLEALTPISEGNLAIEFTPGGPRLAAVNERNQVIYQFDLENEEWVAVEVPEYVVLTEDEMQVVKDFLADNGIVAEIGPKRSTPGQPGLDQTHFKRALVVGSLDDVHFVLYVPTDPNGEGLYVRVFDDGSHSLKGKLSMLKTQIERGVISNNLIINGILFTFSKNYDLDPTVAERACQGHPQWNNGGTSCREFIEQIGIGNQETVLTYAYTDPSLLTEDDLPLIPIAVIR